MAKVKLEEIISPVQDELVLFEENFQKTLSSKKPGLIFEVTQHLLDKKGKRLRPAFVLLVTKGFGKPEQGALDTAVAIELIHTATLLHDDVIDESEVRRGQSSVSHHWGNLVSVLMGDYLLAKAFKTLVNLKIPPLLAQVSEATERVSIGEMTQIQEIKNYNIEEKRYLQIIADKTASLFSASCECGALLSSTSPEIQEKFKNFGENFGIAFQVIDDLLDISGKAEFTGKEIGNDLKEGKITLPLIHAFRTASSPIKKEIISILENGVEEKQLRRIKEFIQAQKADIYTRQRATEFGEKALDFLKGFTEFECKSSLEKMVEFALQRDK